MFSHAGEEGQGAAEPDVQEPNTDAGGGVADDREGVLRQHGECADEDVPLSTVVALLQVRIVQDSNSPLVCAGHAACTAKYCAGHAAQCHGTWRAGLPAPSPNI